MKRRTLWLTMLCFACSAPAGGHDPQKPAPAPEAETAILALADSAFAAARARDPGRFAAVFSDRPDFVYLINTRLLPSRDSVRSTFAGMLSRQRRFEPVWGTRTVQVLSPGAGVLTGGFRTSAERQSGESWGAEGVVTFVAVREPDGWKIVNWHTTE